MPELCRFFGIVIKMFFRDHQPAHFHAYYGDDKAMISVDNLAVIRGALPPRALGLVIEWATLHQTELKNCWQRAERGSPIDSIPPLR